MNRNDQISTAPVDTSNRPARLADGQLNISGDWAVEQLVLTVPPEGKEYSAGLSRVSELPVGKSFRRKLRDSVIVIPNRMNRNVKKILHKAEFLLECTVGEEE